MDRQSHPWLNNGCNYLCMHVDNGCNYLCMLIMDVITYACMLIMDVITYACMLIHVSKRVSHCLGWYPDTLPWSKVTRHYNDVILNAMASQNSGVSIVCSTVGSAGDQRKHQSSASLAFVRGIHRLPVNSPHKRPVMRKISPFDDVIMAYREDTGIAVPVMVARVRRHTNYGWCIFHVQIWWW